MFNRVAAQRWWRILSDGLSVEQARASWTSALVSAGIGSTEARGHRPLQTVAGKVHMVTALGNHAGMRHAVPGCGRLGGDERSAA